jgi:inosose dehydratase
MTRMRIGNAPCSWGIYGPGTKDVTPAQYLDEIAETGYPTTELGPYGFLPTDPPQLEDALVARGLTLSGAVHVHPLSDSGSEAELLASVDRIAPLLVALGTPHLIIMDDPGRYDRATQGVLDHAQWRAMTAMLETARRHAHDVHGATLGVHPHIASAIELEDQIDRLLEDTGIDLCFDVGHHAFWDQDPIAYMERVWDRIAYLHLKNVDAAVRTRILAGAIHVADSSQAGVFCPLPDGVVDIAAVLAMARDRGFTGPIVVEQDLATDAAETPAALARRNRHFLDAITAE